MTTLDLFCASAEIDPQEWVAIATTRRPAILGLTQWFPGTTHPKRVGWYERHFTDSEHLGDDTMHWWDGQTWRTSPERPPHWLQLGNYPAWRGVDKATRRLR